MQTITTVKENYRLDRRTKDEFKSDIKKCSMIELKIFLRLCQFSYNETGEWPKVKSNGTDYLGEVINIKKVTREPDFNIDDVDVEITHSKNKCPKHFHEKVNKIKDCIESKENSSLVFVNGYNEKNPEYIWINGNLWNKYTKMSIDKYGERAYLPSAKGNIPKACYRYDIDWFKKHWRILPNLNLRNFPKTYKEFVDASKG